MPLHTWHEREIDRLQEELVDLQQQFDMQQQKPRIEGKKDPSFKTGWLNRAVPLAAAVLDRDWNEARDLAIVISKHHVAGPQVKAMRKHW